MRKRTATLHWVLRLTDPASGAEQWHRLFPDDPLGNYPEKSLAEARAEARRLWATRSSGTDPHAERHRRTQAQHQANNAEALLAAQRRVTVRALFDRWAEVDLQPRTTADGHRLGRKDAGAFTLAQFERRVFPRLGTVAAEDVKRGDLIALLDAVKAEGKLRTANVLLTDLKQMFRFALARDIVQRNPLDTVTKRAVGGASVDRDRVLSIEELRALRDALPASGLQARYIAGLWLILATGVRVGEMLGASWADTTWKPAELRSIAEAAGVKFGVVDVAQSSWHLADTKNQRDHAIHLSQFALAQIKKLEARRHEEFGDEHRSVAWVFPNASGDRPVDVKATYKQVSDQQREPSSRLKRRSKATTSLVLPGGRWTAHELRRSAATLMAGLGISGDVIDECLNHIIEGRVRRTYIRDRRASEQALAFDALGTLLANLTPHVASQAAESTGTQQPA